MKVGSDMLICKCGNKVNTKFCAACGNEVNGDHHMLKRISDTEVNLKFWLDKAEKIDAESPSAEADDKKCQAQIVMYRKRISILKDTMARELSQEGSE